MKWILKGIGAIAIISLGVFVFGFATMWLWNYTMPELFHLPLIDFYHALGLVLLSKILFGGFRGRGHWGKGRMLKARWESMDPEEREKFKARFAEKCRHKWGRQDMKVEGTE